MSAELTPDDLASLGEIADSRPTQSQTCYPDTRVVVDGCARHHNAPLTALVQVIEQ